MLTRKRSASTDMRRSAEISLHGSIICAHLASKCMYGEILEWIYPQSWTHHSEGIYFDGALPLCKRQTRLNRLQKYAESLAKYKQQTTYVDDVRLATCELTEVPNIKEQNHRTMGRRAKLWTIFCMLSSCMSCPRPCAVLYECPLQRRWLCIPNLNRSAWFILLLWFFFFCKI